MLTPELFSFLEHLKKNNSREWFEENRKTYNNLRQHFSDVVSLLIHELQSLDPNIRGISSKDSIFRINRDIRFSPDKSPYKTNMGAYIAPGGKRSGLPGYYLHVEPGQCMIAGGIYMPPSKELNILRKEVFNNADEFRSIIHQPDFSRIFGELYGEKLKTAPRGYPKDHPDIDLVRYKSYTVAHPVEDSFMTHPDAMANTMEVYRIMKPLNDFLNKALKDNT